MLRLLTVLSCVSFLTLSAHEVHVLSPQGNSLTIDIDRESSFQSVMEQIAFEIESIEGTTSSELIFDYSFSHDVSRKKKSTSRNYAHIPTPTEKEDIAYIVKTLASGGWTDLLKQKSSLKKAGDRVDHVHPLRFLAYVFSDEQLKAGLHAIHDRSKVWKEFFGGLSESLEEESKKGNMKQEYLNEFAAQVGVNINSIMPAVNKQDWNQFISLLLQHLPRSGNPGRYDM